MKHVELIPKKPIKLSRWARKRHAARKKGLGRAGALLRREWDHMINTPGFTRNPQRTSKYIGILSGLTVKKLVYLTDQKAESVAIGTSAKNKSGDVYLAYHEFGTKTIPARPMRPDLWKKKGKQAIQAIRNAIMEPIK